MTQPIADVQREALAAIAAASTTANLTELDTLYLGRKAGRLTGLMRNLGTLPPDEKPAFGAALNAAKSVIEAAIASRNAELAAAERDAREQRERIDLTLPGRTPEPGRLHPLTQTFERVRNVMLALGFSFTESNHCEEYLFNFDWLNYPPEHPALDEQMSFVLDDDHLMRTHTTPTQGRVLATGQNPPLRYAQIGRCFRRDAVDDTHSHTFHQVDGFAVDKDLSLADLKGVMAEIMRGIFGPEAIVRFRPDYFPFVEPGVEIAVKWGDRWLEVGGAGMIHPNILRRAGIDPTEYSGWAFGFGLDRMPMVLHGVDRLPLFLENDLRFLRQF